MKKKKSRAKLHGLSGHKSLGEVTDLVGNSKSRQLCIDGMICRGVFAGFC